MLIIVEYVALIMLFCFSSCAVAKHKFHCLSVVLLCHATLGAYALGRAYLLMNGQASFSMVLMGIEAAMAIAVIVRFFVLYYCRTCGSQKMANKSCNFKT